jgi:hypothetical protein
MQELSVSDILSNEEYEAVRSRVRKDISDLRALRRVELSDTLVVIFENRETVRYQVQEMLRIEKNDAAERIALELSCFNLLVPRDKELSATLIIRVPEFRSIEERLECMAGLTRDALILRVADEHIPARFEVDDDTVCESDVLYIRFVFNDAQRTAFLDPDIPAFLCTNHKECSAQAPIDGALRRSLIQDLQQ